MTLQILINHYREPQEMVGRMLESLEEQTGVRDFGVAIFSDGTENPLDSDFLNGFPFPVQYQALPHRGICATRNTLLDAAEAEYVMFADADDCLFRSDGLSQLLKAASRTDVVSVPFLQETPVAFSVFRYQTVPHNARWLQGKLFRREYLVKNNLRFYDEMQFSGDMAFIWLAMNLTKNIVLLNHCFYVWKWNKNSVTRKNQYHSVRTYDRMLRCYSLLMEDLEARERFDLCGTLSGQGLSWLYINSNSPAFTKAPREYTRSAEQAVSQFVRRCRKYYDTLEESDRRQAYLSARKSEKASGPDYSSIGKWMDHMEGLSS